jgi:hypothetical protein
MRDAWAFGALFVLSSLAHAAFEPKPLDARSAALGGVLGSSRDCWGVFGNPSALALLHRSSCGFSHTPGIFELKELKASAAAFALPLRGGGAGAGLSVFGGDLYGELTGALGAALRVSEGSTLGASIAIYHLRIRNYGSATSPALSLGAGLVLSSLLTTFVNITNLTGATIGSCHERIPRQIALSLVGSITSSLSLLGELRKESTVPASVVLACQYSLGENLTLRGGASSEYVGASGGIEVGIGEISAGYACQWHRELGFTHTITMLLEGFP